MNIKQCIFQFLYFLLALIWYLIEYVLFFKLLLSVSYSYLFIRYTPPIELDSSRLSLELPDSPSAIAEELSEQENVLNILHAELNTGLRDEQKEEKLWEVQRVVTQLKRKVGFLNIWKSLHMYNF